MKREIKFRVFDGSDYMSSPFTFQDIFEGKIQFTQDCPLMQFTGLHDKNGNEIYEGDIVSMHQFLFDGNEVEKECKGVIGYMLAEFSLKQIHSAYLEEYTGYKAGEYETPLCNFYGLHEESFEVIGNIYESPELITL